MHHIIGMNYVEMHIGKIELFELGLQLGGVAHKLDMQIIKPCSFYSSRHNHRGAKVPAHGVHGNDGALVHYSFSLLAITWRPL